MFTVLPLSFGYAHLSKEEVAEIVAPHQDTFRLVHSWLAHYRILSSSILLTITGFTGVPVSQTSDKLLRTSYQIYKHTGNENKAILRTVGYSLPEALHTRVQTVALTILFAYLRPPL